MKKFWQNFIFSCGVIPHAAEIFLYDHTSKQNLTGDGLLFQHMC